ncbi:MAG: lipopolysaccharide biosynthesis protein [Burkholderiales bacterium]
MNSTRSHFHRTADGTIWTFLAEALILPTGLISAAYLTRTLGPDGYGLFSLTVTLVSFATGVATALFARGAIKLVSEAHDWQPIATTIVRMHLACGVVTALVLVLLARPIAALLDEPRLTFYLVLFSLEPLLFVVSRGHRTILIGAGKFREQAVPIALRTLFRLLLIIILVESGLSVAGAVLGMVGASLVELVAYRRYVSPRFFPASGFPASRVWNEASAAFFSSLFLALFARVDLFALTSLGLPTREAGFYGAAQNLSIIPGLFATALAPVLLSTLSRMRRDGDHEHARLMSRDAMRLVLGMLPFAAMASGASHEVVSLVFGPEFESAAPLLQWLIFSKVVAVLITIAFIIVIVAGRPALTLLVAAPMLALALPGHLLLVPRFGSLGAAWVTATLEFAGALLALCMIYGSSRVLPPKSTAGRTVLVAGAAWVAAAFWPTSGWWTVGKLGLIATGIAIGYALLGEFSARELAWARSRLPRRMGAFFERTGRR